MCYPFSKSDNLLFFLREGPFYSVRSSTPLFNGVKTFWLVMMFLRWWQNHHHSAGGCQKSWEVTCHHSYHFALQAAECGWWQAIWGDSAWLALYGYFIRTVYPDKIEHRPGKIFESVVCPPGGTRTELARHVSHGGMLRGVATWTSGGFPIVAFTGEEEYTWDGEKEAF